MLDIARVDLSSIAEALEDHSEQTRWWFDPATGEVEPRLADRLLDEEDEELPEDRGLVPIEPVHSSLGYRDMEDFIARVRDPRARDLLERAIGGRGAFRRFKDTLFDFPQLRAAWFAYHDARMQRRAIEWLSAEGFIDESLAEREIDGRPDPDLPEIAGPFDPIRIAGRVVEDLRRLYGARLRDVILFGSWARGDAHPESDIDLLVVLDRVEAPWEELRAMEPILWRHSFANDSVVTAIPFSESSLRDGRTPLARRAADEGRSVA